MQSFIEYAKSVFQHCEHLATFTQSDGIINRQYLTSEHKQANGFVASLMQSAGMKTWQDEAGNQWGSYRSTDDNAKTLVIGSHLDTVPNGGKYDGILGVVLPIAFIQYCADNKITLPFNLDIVGFADEEGSRFGTTLLGSRAVAGTWQEKWANLKDANEICLAQAMRDFGLDINHVQKAKRNKNELLGFIELHIEQGPVLEAENVPVGIVSAIAGAKRLTFSVKGNAGHAGTVPMKMRQDALVASSEIIVAIEKLAVENHVVATSGFIENSPNAVNVISGECHFSLDIRSQNDHLRDRALESIIKRARQIVQQRGLQIEVKQTHEASAVQCAHSFIDALCKATTEFGITPLKLPSGAGHDAMAMAELCPAAMLFIRCEKGISHHPDESVTVEDINSTLGVFNNFIMALANA